MSRATSKLFWAALVVAAASTRGPAAEQQGSEQQPIEVLSDHTLLRTWMVFRTPVVIGSDGEFKEPFTPEMKGGELIKHEIGQYQSPLPDDAWRSADFDDSGWKRERVPVEKQNESANRQLTALHSATPSAMICARAKFMVDDPAKVGDLRLALAYVGGVAVFVNGKEVTREHLPDGELRPDTLAEQYPDDLYITADGKSMQHVTEHWKAYKRDEERFDRRYRHRKDVVIPASMLQEGLNVLGLQLHRAPVHEAATAVARKPYGGMGRVYGLWAYVALTDLSLTASDGAGIRPNLGKHGSGVQVWNCPPSATLTIDSFGDPGAVPVPVEIDAVRNGANSGRFVISSDRAIESLNVEVSELRTENGKAALPAEAVQVRHGKRAMPAVSPRPETMFDGLYAGVPSRVEYVTLQLRDHARREDYTVNGAIVPVWITVRPPKNAVPGLYTGRVTVRAAGLDDTVVPLRCRVHGWTLPDPIDYRVKNLSVFGPYSLAEHYEVPLWSERHFDLVEKSFCLMAEINARRVDVDMVPGLRYGVSPVEHSMFRLVRKKEGNGYDYDFSVIEKLFGLVEKTMKSPLPLQINCWGFDQLLDRKTGERAAVWNTAAKQVPVLDPATGKLSHIENPPPGTEENYAFWRPILDELRERIEKRGWFAVTAIGHQSYCWAPNPKQVDVARHIWPDGTYSFTSHNGTLGGSFKGPDGTSMPVRYSECVWSQGRLEHRGYRRLLEPGRDRSIWNSCDRNGHHDRSPLALLLRKPEEMIMRGHDGLGYLCADFLPIENENAQNERARYYQLKPNVGGIMGYSTTSLLAAGPDGPVATGRYEMFREGVQRCEAILYLQRALDAKRIDGDLANRVNEYLDERSDKFLKPDWPFDRRELDRRLFELAAEVTAATQRRTP